VSSKDGSVAAKKDPKSNANKSFAARPDKSSDPWWGDDYWKTTRNADKWSTKAPSSPANNEQR